jgi:hypothetical protein
MGLLSFLAGSKKMGETAVEAGKNITDGIVSGIDALILTDEEKIQYNQKGLGIVLEFWDKIAKENTEQSKARRELAKMTFKVFFSMLLMAIAVYKFDIGYAKFILEIAGTITFIVSAITVIYFGPHQIAKIWTKNDK